MIIFLDSVKQICHVLLLTFLFSTKLSFPPTALLRHLRHTEFSAFYIFSLDIRAIFSIIWSQLTWKDKKTNSSLKWNYFYHNFKRPKTLESGSLQRKNGKLYLRGVCDSDLIFSQLNILKTKSLWEKPKMLICRSIFNLPKKCHTNYFWPLHQ